MKARTLLERKVRDLSENLGDIPSRAMAWCIERCVRHICLNDGKGGRCRCAECGHIWDGKPGRCPECGRKLETETHTRSRTFRDRAYFGIVQRLGDFMVERVFFLDSTLRLGKGRNSSVDEVYQRWVDGSGKVTTMGKDLMVYPYYRFCPYSRTSDMSIKRNGYWYDVKLDATYPLPRCTERLRRNGLRTSFHGMGAADVMSALLSDNRFETLWKLGMYGFAKRYLYSGKEWVTGHWKQVIRSHSAGYRIKDAGMWMDYIDLLETFGKDTENGNLIFPENLAAEHNRYVEKKRRRDEEERAERERQRRAEDARRNREKLKAFMDKSKYFGISFKDDKIMVKVLSSIEEYRTEGDLQHHCVYTNGYYGKKGSLILSARKLDTPDTPLETIEFSLNDGRILQCYGKYNKATEYHQQVLDLVAMNAKRILCKK